MKILLSSSHRYPAQRNIGAGLSPTPYPSSSAYATFDLLAQGLLEIGHDVQYFLEGYLKSEVDTSLPIVKNIDTTVDINHRMLDSQHNMFWKDNTWPKEYVISCHIHPKFSQANWGQPCEKWICPSHFLANALNIHRFVYNGINPDEYIYSSVKEDYFVFMASMEWGKQKGIETAIKVSQKFEKKLIVLGGAKTMEKIRNISDLCDSYSNVTYLGDIRGTQKAEILAGASCLLFPTELDESFGLSMVEALISGTPVICSNKGACPEIITNGLGFVCNSEQDYYNAAEKIGTISPSFCHTTALKQYHYRVMAQNFVQEYLKELK